MTEENRLRLKKQLPETFKIESAMDYESYCKVRGLLGQWAVIIEWNYTDEPDRVWLATHGISTLGKEGPCDLNQLKNVLLSLS